MSTEAFPHPAVYCTSGREIPGVHPTNNPCGQLLAEVGRTKQKDLPVFACRRCDNLPRP